MYVNEDLTTPRARLFLGLGKNVGGTHVRLNEGLLSVSVNNSWLYINNLFELGDKLNWNFRIVRRQNKNHI